ncbi:zinc finger domain protein [Fusarium subglutinans]|uniref:Zinc finger domain protein n=1 Tax=Gibberella subglutinans TaxID=42677 RepID=A0A8H5KKR7_GIBSU|nr:zinc finger domain protein [Fusarium subglutinans]KAF5574984.1 zinc finger domain protein [Fusarium subglutinans]
MASNSRSPLRRLPLEIVANILGHSDSIKELGTSIFSHSIFYNAFKANSRSIAKSIITTQIPEKIIPYALLLLESDHHEPGDLVALRGMLARLCPQVHGTDENVDDITSSHHVSETASRPLSLSTLSMSDYASLSRNYEAILLLRQIMAEESLPILRTFGLKEAKTPLRTAEKFRLDRAFYLFQTICNLFSFNARPDDLILTPGQYLELVSGSHEYIGMVFYYFSPWVNHQLQSVYSFLERHIVSSFRYIAKHDVAYVAWTDTHEVSDRDDLNIDELFTRGLSFHLKLHQTKTFEAISHLLKPSSNPVTRWGISDVFDCLTDPMQFLVREQGMWTTQVQDLTEEELGLIQRPHDGEFDGVKSSSCRNWKCAFERHLVSSCRLDTEKSWLLRCAYVMWDYPDVPESFLSETFQLLFNTWINYQALPGDYPVNVEWDRNPIYLSWQQRRGIYARGGEGWWPATGVDFSRVTGLTEKDKEELIMEWRSRGWVESIKRKRSDSSSSRSSVESTITVRERYA